MFYVVNLVVLFAIVTVILSALIRILMESPREGINSLIFAVSISSWVFSFLSAILGAFGAMSVLLPIAVSSSVYLLLCSLVKSL